MEAIKTVVSLIIAAIIFIPLFIFQVFMTLVMGVLQLIGVIYYTHSERNKTDRGE